MVRLRIFVFNIFLFKGHIYTIYILYIQLRDSIIEKDSTSYISPEGLLQSSIRFSYSRKGNLSWLHPRFSYFSRSSSSVVSSSRLRLDFVMSRPTIILFRDSSLERQSSLGTALFPWVHEKLIQKLAQRPDRNATTKLLISFRMELS